MKDHLKHVRWIALLLVALFACAFIPVFPNDIDLEDPVILPDPRVEVGLSSTDLAQVLELVRGSRFSSLYQRKWIQTQLPLRSITSAVAPVIVADPNQRSRVLAPPGEVQAIFAAGCRPDCQDGVTYYLTKRGGGWRIIKVERWVV